MVCHDDMSKKMYEDQIKELLDTLQTYEQEQRNSNDKHLDKVKKEIERFCSL